MAQAYTSNSYVKTKLGIGITDTTDDAMLATMALQVNAWLETKIGYPVGPITSEERLFDGSVVSEDGYALSVNPFGVRAISAVRTASTTDGSYTSRTASDVVIRPHSHERETDWPGMEIRVKDNVSWTFPVTGYDVVGITATWGWAAVPPELTAIADKLLIAMYRNRQHGGGSQYMVGEDGATVPAEELTAADWYVIRKYRFLSLPVEAD